MQPLHDNRLAAHWWCCYNLLLVTIHERRNASSGMKCGTTANDAIIAMSPKQQESPQVHMTYRVRCQGVGGQHTERVAVLQAVHGTLTQHPHGVEGADKAFKNAL